jgi:hypothetical protein
VINWKNIKYATADAPTVSSCIAIAFKRVFIAIRRATACRAKIQTSINNSAISALILRYFAIPIRFAHDWWQFRMIHNIQSQQSLGLQRAIADATAKSRFV